MKTTTRVAALTLALSTLLSIGLVGCASTTTQYYSLAGAAPLGAVSAVANANTGAAASSTIELAPVAMPERFARPQMVVRKKGATDGSQVDILEDSRWASSFEDELRDALASGVAARLGAIDATRAPRPRGQPVTRIAVQLQSFDAMQDRSVDGSFSWSLRKADDSAGSIACRAALTEPVGGGIDAVAAGTQRLVGKLADAIASSVSAMRCPA